MKRQQVESSNLASIGYDLENQILEVEFKHGGIYQYFEVPENIFEELMNADSHGVYFSANIRNEYEFSKL
jgi:hypothetical protein